MRRSRYIPQDVKIKVAARDGGKCTRCGKKLGLQFHHDKPYAQGGRHTSGNLRLLCKRCHRIIHGKT